MNKRLIFDLQRKGDKSYRGTNKNEFQLITWIEKL